ncbi:zinc ribbon domain-containing protein [bacterium]|nr:zinc ribbon domain-containing protein [bacterium]
MPIYLYEREDGSTFEKIQKVSDEILSVCPTTGQKVVRKITPTAIHFKGSGFYKTDYTSSGASSPSNDSKAPTSESSNACNGKGPSGGCGTCSTDA